MNAARRVVSVGARRGYATSTRPLPRPKDPLTTSKNAVISELAPGVTFIHRPPPSAPTPHSLTTAPSSPLLQKVQTSLAPSPAAVSTEASSNLPPVLGSGPPEKRYHLTPSQIEEMRALRASDPKKYTAGVLAKQFDCTVAFVQITAPASKTRRLALDTELQEQKDGWGYRKRLQREIRQKRRSLW